MGKKRRYPAKRFSTGAIGKYKGRTVHRGPKGGKYVIVKGQRRYIPKNAVVRI